MTSLLHLSDPHFGAHDPAIAERLIHHAAELQPTLTVLTGDLSMRARRSELTLARRFAEQLPQPRIVLPGNHDVPSLNHPWQRLFAPFQRFRSTISDDLEPTWSSPQIELISLNTNRGWGFYPDWSEGRTNRSQRARLEAHFEAFPGPPPLRILALHHPVICPPDHPRALVKPLRPLHKSIATARIDLVLGGHFHQSYGLVLNAGFGWSSLISQVSTACSTRTQAEPQGFHLLQLTPTTITCVRYYWDAPEFRVRDRIATRRSGAGWRLNLNAASARAPHWIRGD